VSNVRVRGFDELKIRNPELLGMTDLKVEKNEEIEHHGQTLVNNVFLCYICLFSPHIMKLQSL